MSETEILSQLSAAVENLDLAGVVPLTRSALDQGMAPAKVLNEGLSAGMREVGKKFNSGDMFMPEVLVACDVYFAGLDVVRPLLAADRTHVLGKIIMGNIHGDVHTVGKQVAMPVFEASGFEVVDLGEDLNDEAFVEGIRKHNPQVVGLGTYMTSTFMHTAKTVEAITKAGLRDKVKIICGGPAVDAEAARRMGADDASDDAWKGVEKIKRLLGIA
ncbi:MAG TPA: cobalamin-dependent protein [Phycisphaerae bacterium]|nr:cobalamin-dependent protein [Phycisphaerae bacterium]HOJ73717.1 cobalamin-dependent protein [Phycisphaerae bacterium]HOM50364.1 cobalamin-dependent protein [Phycisphaerae bacterium]HON67196.1 cobalamin-dependent protein [Phycisphaerae bacterium]HOQ84224.1 cobalamin-dependent protein [Phycisphaerae bacterium]